MANSVTGEPVRKALVTLHVVDAASSESDFIDTGTDSHAGRELNAAGQHWPEAC